MTYADQTAGHTPGPWGYEDPLGPDILSIVANPDAPPYEWVHVAQIGFTDDEDDARSFDEHEANARLIAAAPEMLECLIEARSLLSDPDAIDLGYLDEVIAKAKGGAA